jgi:uncharacterized protein
MTLEERIFSEYGQAMKAKNTIKSSILSLVRAEIMNTAMKKNKPKLDDAEIVAVIKKQVKQHEDSISQFKQGNRQDLVEKEEKELLILKAYVPAEISADEVKKIVDEAIAATGAEGVKDMGKVMKEVLAKTSGQADGKMVSELVREKLSPKPA